MRMTYGLAALAAMMAVSGLSGCAKPRPLYVDQAWIQLNANPAAPAAGYFTVHGGGDPVLLRSVSTEAAQRLEMHESMAGAGGMMTMKPIDSVEIPAKTDIAFAPGGRHLMLWAINPAVAATGKVTLTFIFSNGDRLLVDALVRKAGDSAGSGTESGNAAAPSAATHAGDGGEH